MDSIELVELLKQNKEKGLSCLYDQYAPTLNGIVTRIIASEAQAEEVLQQIFLRIAYSIDSYDRENCSLFTWMSRIARQEALLCPGQYTTIRQINGSIENQSSSLSSSITPAYREVLDRMYVLGYTPSETALHLDIPVATVKSRLRMAVNQMTQMIQNDPGHFLNKTLFIILSLAAAL